MMWQAFPTRWAGPLVLLISLAGQRVGADPPSPPHASGGPPAASAETAAPDRELLGRLKNEFAEAGDDLDRKRQLIDWALEHGRPAVVALHPLALREGKARLGQYGQEFRQRIPEVGKKNVAAVLAADPKLQTMRADLVRFSAMAGKLRDAMDGRTSNVPAAEGEPDFETFLHGQEQSLVEAWKMQMGYGGLDDDEIVVLELTNRIRREHGLSPLMVDSALCLAARDHSKDMQEKDFFAHESPLAGKQSVADRARRAGTSASAENIYAGRSGEGAMEAWMKSEGHRRNLLNEQHRRIGVGRYERMFTQMFGS